MTIWGGIPEAGEGAETEAVSGLDKAAGILYFLFQHLELGPVALDGVLPGVSLAPRNILISF